MRRAVAFAIGIALASPLPARAQQTADPEPILRATIDPPRVVVGQQATLRVEILAPNYMTSPPVLPEFQIRNAVTRKLQSLNLNERHGEITYAGVRYEFAIYPQEPGSFAVADQKITVKYAAAPPKTRETTLPVPRIAFEAFIPDAAAQLDPFVAANRLTIQQSVRRSADELKVGGAVTRTITIKAEGTPAMLLPPTQFAPINGLAAYPIQPVLQDSIDSRTDVLSASRTDSATYMLEAPGNYLLPAVTLRWWNPHTNKIETARIDTVNLHVVNDPTTARVSDSDIRSGSRWNTIVDVIVHFWPLILISVGALTALVWFLPGTVRTTGDWYRRQRDAYLSTESWAFTRLLWTARHRDAGSTYSALVGWLERFDPIAPSHTIKAFKAAAQNVELDKQLNALETELFALSKASIRWSARKLLWELSVARRGLLRKNSAIDRTQPLPQRLNPVPAYDHIRHARRPVAR